MNLVRPKEASPAQVALVRDRVRLIDVREPAEYTGELRHVPEAELIPLATLLSASQAWDKDAALIMICRSGARSGRAAEALAAEGFKDVTNMVGGMLAWNQAGLPVA